LLDGLIGLLCATFDKLTSDILALSMMLQVASPDMSQTEHCKLYLEVRALGRIQ
jgi:hypothetical protein